MLTKVGRSIGSVIQISGRSMPINGNSEVCGGTKMNDLCWVCVDIFADHVGAECPVGPGFENPSLLEFWDNPEVSFVKFIGAMVEHARGAQTGPCPLCKVQEDQHDYATCLRMVSLEMKGDELSVTTN